MSIAEMARDDASKAKGMGCPKERYNMEDGNFEIYIEAFELAIEAKLEDQALRGR